MQSYTFPRSRKALTLQNISRQMNWLNLESSEDWNAALEQSKQTPIAILKHSTRCSVSFMAKKNLESRWEYNESQVIPYYLDLIAFRSISDLISQHTGIRHESPQLILIKDGEVQFHTSHYGIDAEAIARYIA
jgi:bacillithiol system protein YtxJ